MSAHLIRYEYPGTTNGRAVGLVYVREVGPVSPGSYSHTYDPAKATTWPTREAAEAMLAKMNARGSWWWNGGVVPLDGAPMLGLRP